MQERHSARWRRVQRVATALGLAVSALTLTACTLPVTSSSTSSPPATAPSTLAPLTSSTTGARVTVTFSAPPTHSSTAPAPVTTKKTSTPPPAPNVFNWVEVADSKAISIGWTQTGSRVTGDYSAVVLKPGATSVTTELAPYKGVLRGSAVTLTFDGVFSSPISGRMAAGALILSFPQSDGSVAPVTFKLGSADEYNLGVKAVQSKAALAAAGAQQSANGAYADLKVDAAAENLNAALRSLQADQDPIPSSIATVQEDLAVQSHDLDVVQAKAATVIAEAKRTGKHNAITCADAAGVQASAVTVQSAGEQVSSDVAGGSPVTLRTDIAAFSSANAALIKAQAAAPGYSTSARAPTPTQVASELATAGRSLDSWRSTAVAAVSKAGSMTTSAQHIANGASDLAGC